MTKEELAAKLNGRQIDNEITREEAKEAAQNGLIVIFGASDDLCEIRGRFDDEVGCFDGGHIYLTKKGLYERKCEDEGCPHEEKILDAHQVIYADWCKSETYYSWTYRTDIPHAAFDVFDGEEQYCRGIVISIEDLK